jgi:Zn-dependent protease with chaperone function
MKKMNARIQIVALCLTTWVAIPAEMALAQTRVEPGFNLFSVDQDREIGKQSAKEAEARLPILRDRSIEAFVGAIGSRLAAVAPGANYDYQFKVVNASDINAFALPGGYLYLNRGLIEAARNEGQLAGVMAHEMAHVALRHGTNQASKAYLGQTGLGLLGGLIGKDDHSTDSTISAVGGFGLNSLFLKFSRHAEEQADVTGAQMMAKAGYDPKDMVDFFDMLADKRDHDPSKVEQFFSSHPSPENRGARIDNEIAMLAVRPTRPVGGFAQAKAELSRMRPAKSLQQITDAQARTFTAPQPGVNRPAPEIMTNRPSSQFLMFAQPAGLFQIGYPENWSIHTANQGYGVIIAPDGGFVDTGGQERDLISGVIVNHYDPFGDEDADRFSDSRGPIEGRTSLTAATNDLIGQILRTNPNLQMISDSERTDRIDGAPSLSVVLSGTSPVTRQEERVTVFTRKLGDDHVIYALFIAPDKDYGRLNETFNRMISSLEVGDEAAHLSSVSNSGTVPSGTVFAVEFQQTLSSETSLAGDPFTARVVDSVLVDGKVVIGAGSIVSGRVVSAQPSKKIGGRAQIDLEFTSLELASGGGGLISASFLDQGEGQTKKDAATIGAAAAAGAVLGRILGDSHNAVLGAVIGGAIGTGIAARNQGEEVTLPAGTTVEIHLDSPFEA